jgi:hypothetical protein
MPTSFALLLAAAAFAPQAHAVELELDGFYRARMRLFDTLSLDRTLPNSEGLSLSAEHRLVIRPKLLINDHVALMADIRGFDGAAWGSRANAYVDPVTGEGVPVEFTESLTAPDSTTGDTPKLDISLWRAWGEVNTKYGTIRFGRQPLHWGLGAWQNDGMGYNADFGDTADRVSFETEIQKIWIRGAVDIHTEGFINQTDDTTAYNLAFAYRGERVNAGLQAQYRATPSREFNLFTVDGAGDIELGPFDAAFEVVGQFGGGNLSNGAQNVQVTAVGAALDLRAHFEPGITVGLLGVLATGDGETADRNYRTYTFDRDFNVGFLMFEQPMPVLKANTPNDVNGGRDYDPVLTGQGVSNALLLRAFGSKEIVPGLSAEAAFVAARTAKVPTTMSDRQSYGMEINAGLRWKAYDAFELGGHFGAFIPGTYYKNYRDTLVTSGYNAPAFGGQVIGRISF